MRKFSYIILASFILKIKHAEAPFYRFLNKIAKATRATTLPLPRFVHPLRFAFHCHGRHHENSKRIVSYFYIEPVWSERQ